MKIAFTPQVAYRLIDRAKSNFRNHKYAPKEWKDTFDKLSVYVCVNESIPYYPGALAMSYMLNTVNGRDFGIDPLAPKTKIGGREYWLALEFAIDTVCQADGPSLFNLVCHEVTHSLDYVIRGKMQETNEGSHDEFFRVLMNFMGATEDYRFPHRTKLAYRRKKSIESFGGLGVVALPDTAPAGAILSV